MLSPRQVLRQKALSPIPAILAFMLAVACGALATAISPPAATTPASHAAAATAVPAAVPPTAPLLAATSVATQAKVTKPFIADVDIDPDRSRVPVGQLNMGYHAAMSPTWLTPSLSVAGSTGVYFVGTTQDAMIKPCNGNSYCYSLAEFYDMSQDFKTATLRLRKGLKFHNRAPLTTEDVKFSYEDYRGPGASLVHKLTESIEIVDDRTIKFHFKEPFLDFLVYYGSHTSFIQWVIPKNYYLSLGSDTKERDMKFAQAPVGVGPYKLVRQVPGASLEFEAWTDYWRKVPHIKTVLIRSIPDRAVRWASLKAGEVDFAYSITGDVLKAALNARHIKLAPNLAGNLWYVFPDWVNPSSPFHDQRVRQAVSLALDRQFVAERQNNSFAGMGGGFVDPRVVDALERPTPPFDLQKAKQLMKEAGYENGFKIDWYTPFPGHETIGLRVMDQLREIGITGELQVMERPVYYEKLRAGRVENGVEHKGFPGRQIVSAISAGLGNAAIQLELFALCGSYQSIICIDEVDSLWKRYLASSDLQERSDLIKQIQAVLLDGYHFVPLYVEPFIMGMGPRVAGAPEDYLQRPLIAFPGNIEDIKLK